MAAEYARRESGVMALLRSEPKGMHPREIASRLGLTYDVALACMRSLRKLGKIDLGVGGPNARWAMPEDAKRLKQQIKEMAPRPLVAKRAPDHCDYPNPLRLLRAVGTYPPIVVPPGARSVFDYAST